MKVQILFGLRKGSYPGQYAPETLAVQDEYGNEDNPEWIHDTKADNEQTGEFESLAVITFEVSEKDVWDRLQPERVPLVAEISG